MKHKYISFINSDRKESVEKQIETFLKNLPEGTIIVSHHELIIPSPGRNPDLPPLTKISVIYKN